MHEIGIVIPTRNRPEQLRLTLKGLAMQDFKKFSVVVSDNSDELFSEQNTKTIDDYKTEIELQYVRPSQVLNMVQHWNFAVTQLNTKYVGIITDRMTLIPGALSLLSKTFNETNASCISYEATSLRLLEKHLSPPATKSKSTIVKLESKKILHSFSEASLTKKCPRFLNSFIHTDVLNSIEKKFGSVFSGISPDYNFLFKTLSILDNYHHINEGLLLDHSPEVSNGVAISNYKKNSYAKDFLSKVRKEQAEYIAIGPIPNELNLLTNSILRELEIVRLDCGNQELPELNAKAIYNSLLNQLYSSKVTNTPYWVSSRDLVECYRKENRIKKKTLIRMLRYKWRIVRNKIKTRINAYIKARNNSATNVITVEKEAQLIEILLKSKQSQSIKPSN